MNIDITFLRKGLKKSIGYTIKTKLVILGVLPALILAVIAGFTYGWDNQLYYKCGVVQCENPWHESYLGGVNVDNIPEEMMPYKDMRFFPPGFEVGTPPPAILTWAWVLLFVGPTIAFIANHKIYNKNWRRKCKN